MRLFYCQFVAAVFFGPLLLKRRVQGGKQLAGDVIRTVQQFRCLYMARQQQRSDQRE
ncbi:Uncharacterised protein [Shigella sonnei]|nr:Uncharacterised protein [Shigella sonnei]